MNSRNQTICQMYQDGYSISEVGEQYGLTRQRIHQIISGRIKTRHHGAHRKAEYRQRLEAVADRIRNGSTVAAEAQLLGITSAGLRHALRKNNLPIPGRWKEHGTSYRYSKGCHCEECSAAWREMLERRYAKGPPEHGTANGYTNYQCRCVPCKRAGSIQNRQVRLRRQMAREVVNV